ncbi:MAG: D-3-phosphoglycerate dehydrogenase [Deltaproteobacteria bacterium]|nr:MAG: D-3-phosphoglycerate dehydrogenase [Deltaproteobacteria bacterium]
MKILVTDGLSEEGLKILRSHPELEVTVKKGLPKEELKQIIADYDALIVRSGTKVTADIIEAAGNRLKVIGRAGIGVDNVDVDAATRKGIVVMNTPEANAVTTAEHTIALMLALARKIPQAHFSLKSGLWEREKFKGREIFGKTLGIIGLGNIGRLVAERAIGLKMKVIAYDPFLTEEAAAKLGVEQVSLDNLLERADIITIHTPLTPETKNLIDKRAFMKMKKGVILINCARGGIVNEGDLFEALRDGRVGGAALDVYEKEPPDRDNPLFTLEDNVVFTPHLGASTEEAQTKVSVAIAEQIVDFFLKGVVRNAVNMPSISLELLKVMKPYLTLAEKLGSFQGQICKSGVEEIQIEYSGEVADFNVAPLTIAALKGFLSPIMDIVVSYVNAPVIAREKGIKVVESKSSKSEDFTSLISIKVKTNREERLVAGTIFGKEEPRFVRVNGFSLDVIPEGCLIISENYDKPGFIGAMGTVLGKHGINIARMHLGRESIGGRAISFINVDSPVPEEVLEEISKLPNIISVTQVVL